MKPKFRNLRSTPKEIEALEKLAQEEYDHLGPKHAVIEGLARGHRGQQLFDFVVGCRLNANPRKFGYDEKFGCGRRGRYIKFTRKADFLSKIKVR